MSAEQKGMRKNFIERVLPVFASMSIVFLFGIALTLVLTALPAFKEVGFFKLVFGTEWRPTFEPPYFGILPLIISSVIVTIGAIIFAVPLGVGSLPFNCLPAALAAAVSQATGRYMDRIPTNPELIHGYLETE